MNDTPIDETADDNQNHEALEDAPKLSADEEINAAVERSSVKEKKKRARKKNIKYGAGGLVTVMLSYIIYLLFIPYTGTNAFGLCKTFLELKVRYPHTLYLSTVEELGSSIRIWYTQIDSFGEYRMEPIRCYFKQDDTYGMALEKVTIRRRQLDAKIVEDFNRSIGIILAVQPDLTVPAPLPDSLKGLQFQTDSYRKPIL